MIGMDIKKLAKFNREITLNVWELIEEAKLLYKHGHYPRAYTLAHLALEENAKLTVLLFLAVDILHGKIISTDELARIFSSKLFTNHKLKLRLVFLKLPNYSYQKTINNVNELNTYKNHSLYTDVINGDISKPSNFFREDKASAMIDIVEMTLQKGIEDMGLTIKNIPTITVDMIESNYRKIYLDSGAVFLDRKASETYADVLMRIVKTPQTFDEMKARLFISP